MDNYQQEKKQKTQRDTSSSQQQLQLQIEERNILHEETSSTSRRIKYPPGYRFCPNDEELILYYLRPKVANLPLPFDGIQTTDINKYSPESIKNQCKWDESFKENEMYIFTPRLRKYANGTRPDRTVPEGNWKPTGVEKIITLDGQIIGYKKQLDFYEGPAGDGKRRTHWKMHEYRIDQTGPAPNKNADGQMNMQLDKHVLCKIYLSTRKKGDGDHGNGNTIGKGEGQAAGQFDGNSEIVPTYDQAFEQNKNNNNLDTSIVHTFARSSTSGPNGFVQMYGMHNSSIDQQHAGNYFMKTNNYAQTVQTNEAEAFINNYVNPISWGHFSSEQNHISEDVHQYSDQMLGRRNLDQYPEDSIMNVNNHGQIVQTYDNNLVGRVPSAHNALALASNSSQMFDHNSSLMDLSSCYGNNLFPYMESFPPTASATHVEPNYYQIMASSNFSDPCMYMKPINIDQCDEVDLPDAVKDCK